MEVLRNTILHPAGTVNTYGRRAWAVVVETLAGSSSLQLPTLIECDFPNIREDIQSPAAARHHPHLTTIAKYLPEIDDFVQIMLSIGRDLSEAHHDLEQFTGPCHSPYAQRLLLGWVVVGEACLSQFHRPDTVIVNRTYMLRNGRSSIYKPCPNNFEIKEKPTAESFDTDRDSPRCDIFDKRNDDDTVKLSFEDKEFLCILDQTVPKNAQGYREAPFPF